MASIKSLIIGISILIAMLAFQIPAYAQGYYTNRAKTCTDPYPTNSIEWLEFVDFVKKEYFSNKRYYDPAAYAYAYGHALGRLASAVEQVPAREKKFDCVKKALEQEITAASVNDFSLDKGSVISEASRGMHDDEVANMTGVTSNRPLYGLFGARGPRTPRPSARTHPTSPPPRRGSGLGSGNTQGGVGIFGTGGNTGGTVSGGSPPYNPGYYGGGTTIVTNGVLGGTYTDTDCTSYANFSLANAFPFMSTATTMGRNFEQRGYTDCYGDGWAICRDILAELTKAQTQVNQVFLDATTGNCRKCNLDAVQRYGHKLYEWEQWLVKRGYNSAWGFAKTFSGAIDDHMDDEKCKLEIPESTTIITKDDGFDWSNIPGSTPSTQSASSKPGYYVYKKSGTGYRRKWGSAEYFTGNHITVVKIKPGDTFAGESVQWTANELKSADAACKAPSPPLCPCNIDPEIWVGSPQYTMIEGPFDSETEAESSFSCDKPIYRGYGSVKTCSYWKKEDRPNKELKRVCP